VRVNHHLLNAIGVGHPQCDRVVQISMDHGLAAKITGGGGGGCVITLLSREGRDTTELVDALTHCGFECFEAVVGDDGIKVHSPPQDLGDESRL
jgi:mevalonate kinase